MPLPLSAGPSPRGGHRIELWQRCRQEFAYSRVLHLVPLKEPRGRALGSVMHIGMMHHNRNLLGLPALDPLEAMRQAPARVAHVVPDALEIFPKYQAWEEDHIKGRYRPLSAEAVYGGKIRGQRVTIRADHVAERDHRLVVVDTKTTSSRSPKSAAYEWQYHQQMILLYVFGQWILSPKFDLDFGGVEIQIVGTRLDDLAFHRVPLDLDSNLISPCMDAIGEVSREIDETKASGRDPWRYRRNNAACRGRYGWCDYLALCREGSGALYRYEQVVDDVSEVEV